MNTQPTKRVLFVKTGATDRMQFREGQERTLPLEEAAQRIKDGHAIDIAPAPAATSEKKPKQK